MNTPDVDLLERFFYPVGEVAKGPLDLAELAADWRYGKIGRETPVKRNGETIWMAFGERPEFFTVQGIPVEVIGRHLAEKEHAGAAKASDLAANRLARE